MSDATKKWLTEHEQEKYEHAQFPSRRTIDRLCSRLDAQQEVIDKAHAHVLELRKSWETGALHELDNKGGTRSNRNVDVEVSLRPFLSAAESARTGAAK